MEPTKKIIEKKVGEVGGHIITYKQGISLDDPNMFNKNENMVQERSKIIIKNQVSKETGYHILEIAEKGGFTGEFMQINSNSKLAQLMIGKKEGDKFEFGEMEYVVVRVM